MARRVRRLVGITLAVLLVPVGLDATDLLKQMQQTPAHEYLVVESDGSPAGIIAAIDFARRLKGAT